MADLLFSDCDGPTQTSLFEEDGDMIAMDQTPREFIPLLLDHNKAIREAGHPNKFDGSRPIASVPLAMHFALLEEWGKTGKRHGVPFGEWVMPHLKANPLLLLR